MLTKSNGISCLFANSLIILAVLLSNGQAFAREHQANGERSSAKQQVGRKLRLHSANYIITSSPGFSRPSNEGHLAKIDALNAAICGKTPAFGGHNRKPSNFECPPAGNRRRRRGRTGSPELANRYAGGFMVERGEVPFHVQLMFKRSSDPAGSPTILYIACGGVLISPDLVITAGHCLKEGYDSGRAIAGMVVRSDTRDTQTVNVLGWCRLKEYKKIDEVLSNDIAVLQLAEKINYTDHIQPACLNYKRRQIKGSICFGAGMGETNLVLESPRLIGLPLRDGCNYENSDADGRTCYTATTDLGFFGHACIGDSGGGLYCIDRCANKPAQIYVVGLTSYGASNSCLPSNPPITVAYADLNKMASRLEPLLDGCYESRS